MRRFDWFRVFAFWVLMVALGFAWFWMHRGEHGTGPRLVALAPLVGVAVLFVFVLSMDQRKRSSAK